VWFALLFVSRVSVAFASFLVLLSARHSRLQIVSQLLSRTNPSSSPWYNGFFGCILIPFGHISSVPNRGYLQTRNKHFQGALVLSQCCRTVSIFLIIITHPLSVSLFATLCVLWLGLLWQFYLHPVFFFKISLDWSGSRKTRECLAWREKGTGNTQVPSQFSLRSSLSFFSLCSRDSARTWILIRQRLLGLKQQAEPDSTNVVGCGCSFFLVELSCCYYNLH